MAAQSGMGGGDGNLGSGAIGLSANRDKGLPRGASRLITLLSTLGFFAIFSSTMSKSPVLPLFLGSMEAGTDIIGLIAAISPIAGIVFSFPVGLLADRMGKKRLLVVAASVFATAPLLYLLAPSAL